MIDEEATFKLFGYYSTDLKPKSRKKIVVICDNQNCEGDKVRVVSKHKYTSLCRSCSQKERYKDPLERKKASEVANKRWENPSERKKASESANKRWEDISERKKASETANKRWSDPEEHEKAIKRLENPLLRERIREGQLKRFEDPLERKKVSERMSGDNNPMKRPEIAAKLSDIMKNIMPGVMQRPDVKKNQLDGIRLWSKNNPKQVKINRTKAGLASVKSQRGKPSSIEFKMRDILADNDYQFKTNEPLLNICIPDIVFHNEKVIIQCDGDYWHNYPDGLDKDYRQDEILKRNGWQVIRFWEHEINSDINGCLEKFKWETFRRFNV